MAEAKLISPISKQTIQKLRVAAYCRVSSSSADQLNSYTTQVRYYTKLIHSKDEWELVEVFADEGISGMRADNRTEFQRMIRMCELKQIDLILTKSVSRFARNVPVIHPVHDRPAATRGGHRIFPQSGGRDRR